LQVCFVLLHDKGCVLQDVWDASLHVCCCEADRGCIRQACQPVTQQHRYAGQQQMSGAAAGVEA
jgi:hypothetical protein